MPTWYDIFSRFYDVALESQYAPYRASMIEALGDVAGQTVLDLACGTGQNFEYLSEAVGRDGMVLGVDNSDGMLGQAARRIARDTLTNVRIVKGSAVNLSRECLATQSGVFSIQAVISTLGFSAITDWEDAFQKTYDVLLPGGTFVICDIFEKRKTIWRWMVELLARADISREVWIPLEQNCVAFSKRSIPLPSRFGGDLVIARGRKYN